MKSDGYRDANDVASQYVSPKLACLPIPAVAFAQSVGEDCVRMQPLITKAGTPRCFCGLAQGKTGEQNAVLFFRAVGSLARGAAKPARRPPTLTHSPRVDFWMRPPPRPERRKAQAQLALDECFR